MKKTILCMILMVLCASNAFSAFFPIGIDWDIDDMDKKHVQYEFDSVSNGGPVFRILYPLAGGDMPHYFVLMSPDFEVTGMGAFADDRSDGSGITMKEVFDKYYNALVADHGFPLMKAKGNPAFCGLSASCCSVHAPCGVMDVPCGGSPHCSPSCVTRCHHPTHASCG